MRSKAPAFVTRFCGSAPAGRVETCFQKVMAGPRSHGVCAEGRRTGSSTRCPRPLRVREEVERAVAPPDLIFTDPDQTLADDATHDEEPVFGEIVRHQRRLATDLFVDRRGLLGPAAEVGELAVAPHRLYEEGPGRRRLRKPVGEVDPGREAAPESLDVAVRLRHRRRDVDVRLGPYRDGLGLGLLGHRLEALHARPGHESGLVVTTRGREVAEPPEAAAHGHAAEADDEMRRRQAVLGNEERVDAPRLANQSDVRRNALGRGLEEGDVGGAGEGPIFGIADHEVEDGLAGRQGDDSRMADLCNDLVDGLGRVALQPEDPGVLSE